MSPVQLTVLVKFTAALPQVVLHTGKSAADQENVMHGTVARQVVVVTG